MIRMWFISFIIISSFGAFPYGKALEEEFGLPIAQHALHTIPLGEKGVLHHRRLQHTSFSDRHQDEQHLLNDTAQRNRHSKRLLRDRPTSETTPIYRGYGTHFTYVYVGTPPQRQSLIIHTASKYTTFPCTGCNNCGEHTDPYFDISASSTAKILICNTDDYCYSNQTYAEGSSWRGYRVKDRFYVGNDMELSSSSSVAPYFSMMLSFSCQSSLHGVFMVQKENGILGMNGDTDAIPWQLLSQKAIEHKIFALCFHAGGGIMSIGKRIHENE